MPPRLTAVKNGAKNCHDKKGAFYRPCLLSVLWLAVKMANCVKIKMNDKAMRLKSSMLTVGNLAMVFKLDVSRGIYICSEEEGEIIIPTETGVFKVEDFTKTYVVNGDFTNQNATQFENTETEKGRGRERRHERGKNKVTDANATIKAEQCKSLNSAKHIFIL